MADGPVPEVSGPDARELYDVARDGRAPDASSGSQEARFEVPIAGMDCAACVRTVKAAIAEVPGVTDVEVLLASEKALVRYDSGRLELADLRTDVRRAVRRAGYDVPVPVPVTAASAVTPLAADPGSTASPGDPARAPLSNPSSQARAPLLKPTSPSHQRSASQASNLTRRALTLMGIIFVVVLFVVVIGEWLGLFAAVTARVPWWLGALLVLAFGFPVFRKVIRAALRRRVISHTLMTFGALAALAVGEWATAVVVVFFMRVGDYAESLTATRARRSLKDLIAMAPQTARIERDGVEQELPVALVQVGDLVVVRPGETIPVDGEVVAGDATIDQAAITGESMPVEAGPGSKVYAATHAQLGSLRISAWGVGRDTTFGRVVTLVEEAEANRGVVERLADRVSGYYLPIVAGIALATFLVSGNLLAAVAVTVVACSCAFALATPVAMLASIGAAAKHGLLIKGGKVIESLARVDVLLVDKTGTLTLGRPELSAVLATGALPEDEVLRLAASAERDSEHPLAEAVRQAAHARKLQPVAPESFEAVPGKGIRSVVEGRRVAVGSYRLLEGAPPQLARDLEAQGKTLLFVLVDDALVGILAAADGLRSDVPAALKAVREFGITRIELLTGDNERSAGAVAGALGIEFQANLLPEDKIAVVKRYQEQGHRVMMIGDGVNDAPALAQADVGVAMAVAGSAIAVEAAHVALLREDWSLVPELLRIARRTMGVVKLNIGFTAVYNLVGISLAAVGLLPPILAAALQSIPDLGIMGNSARLLRRR